MVRHGKIEIQVEIQAPADKFFNIFRSQAHHIPNVSDNVHAIDVHEGDWETQGSVKEWKYTLDGDTALNVKETVEEIDDENKIIKFKVIDGELMKDYKNVMTIIQAIPKDEGGLVKWTLEFEKLHDGSPGLEPYLELAEKLTKHIDDHLVKAD